MEWYWWVINGIIALNVIWVGFLMWRQPGLDENGDYYED